MDSTVWMKWTMLKLAGARNIPEEIYARLIKNAFSNSLYFQLITDIADIH